MYFNNNAQSLNFRKYEYTTVFSFDRYQLIMSWDPAITDP